MSKSTKQKLRNIHPGEVLREEFLVPLGITLNPAVTSPIRAGLAGATVAAGG